MSFSPITHIRHFDIAVPDFEKQIEFYKNHWGLTVQHDDGDVVYFAAEGSPEQYVTRVRRSNDKRLDLVAFGAADRQSVDQLAQQLGSSGIQLITEPDAMQTLGGGYGFRFFDLEGRTIEVSTDVEVRQHRKIEEREAIPVRLSHVVLNSNQPEAMRAWYDILGTEIAMRQDEKGVRESIAQLEALIARENQRGIPDERIILAGFSQGGAIVMAAALRHGKHLGGLMALSTYLPMAEQSSDEQSEASKGLATFMAHGSLDPVVPQALGLMSREKLVALGLDVEWHSYAMPHSVSAQEIADIAAWMGQRFRSG